MPTAPTYGQQKASTGALPGVFKQPNRTAADYGATDLPAKLASFAEQVYVKESDQRADDAENNAAAMKRDAIVKRQAEFQGVNAVEGQAKLQEDFKKIDDQMLADLQGNPRATSRYQRSAVSTDLSFQPQITGWVLTERDKAAQATYKSTVETSLKKAASLAPQATMDAASQQAYSFEVAKAVEANTSLLRMQGASQEVIEADNAKVAGAVNAQVVSNFLEIDDVSKASMWFGKFKDTMDPQAAARLQGDIQRRSVKNRGEAFGVSIASDLIKASPRIPNAEAGFKAINDNAELSPAEKRVAWSAMEEVISRHANAKKTSSSLLAKGYVDEIAEIRARDKASLDPSRSSGVVALQDIMSRREWADLLPAEQVGVINAALNKPEDQFQSAIYGVLSEQLKSGKTLDPALLGAATPEIRDYFKTASASRTSEVAIKQHDATSKMAETVLKQYAQSLGKKEGEYLKYAPALIAQIQASPDLGVEMMKNQTLALNRAKKLVDSGETLVPVLHPQYGPRNMEIIKEDLAKGDTDALRKHTATILNWGIAYNDPASRKELIDTHMAVLAEGSGKKWEEWQNEARKELGFRPPQMIDSRAAELMNAAIDSHNRLILDENTIGTVLDSWYNPITGPSNPGGNLIKKMARNIVPYQIAAAQAVSDELRRGFPAYRASAEALAATAGIIGTSAPYEATMSFGREVERGMWMTEEAITKARKAAGNALASVYDFVTK